MHERLPDDAVFRIAFSIESPELRTEYLRQIGTYQPEVRDRVQALLEASSEEPGFLEPAADSFCQTLEMAASVPDVGSRVGLYTLREQIGEGGMGVVYVAEQTEPVRRKVALKIIRPGMATKDVLARFETERQALALMDHPNIAHVFDGGSTEVGHPYFVMELVQGLPITEYCDQHRLSPRERLAMFIKVCRAVQHAHRKGIIHRDLKPSNVLVSRVDGVAVPKVIDFGVAKAINQKISDRTIYTQFRQLVGTPLYMSPEQVELGVVDIDTRSDVYSLGVLLYELLTGCTPIERETLDAAGFDETRRMIREQTPQRPSVRVSTLEGQPSATVTEHCGLDSDKLSGLLRGELDWVVMKALEKDRDRRYESCNALALDLQRFLDNEPVVARPANVFYRARKFAQRNRLLVVATVSVVLAVSLGLAMSLVGLLEAREQLAEVNKKQATNEKLIDLLGTLYGSTYGAEAQAGDLTLRESLDKVSAELETGLEDSPDVEIRARRIFANAYRRFGELEKADKHLETALKLAEKHYGPHHEQVADVLVDLADDLQWHHGQPIDIKRSQDYARRALVIYDRLGIEKPDLFFVLGFSLSPNIDCSDEAEGYLRRKLTIYQRRAGGKDTHDVVFGLFDLALHLARTQMGREEEVNQLMNQAVAMSEHVHADQPTTRATVITVRGKCFFLQGKNEEAIKCYRKSWDIFRQEGFEREDSALGSAIMLAEICLIEHRHREGIEVIDEIEAIAREHELWSWLVECYHLRAFGELLREDYETAEQHLRKAIELADRHNVETQRLNVWARIKLACLLEAKGQSNEAKKQCLALTSNLRPDFFGFNEWSPGFYYVRARSLLCLGEFDEADKAAEEGLRWAEKGPPHRRQPHLHLIRAIVRNHKGDSQGAIRLLNETLDTTPFPALAAHSTAGAKTRRELENTLAQYRIDAGDFEAARNVYEKGIAAREDQYPDNPTDADRLPVALAKLRFGTFLLDQRKFESAKRELLESYDLLSNNTEAASATIERATRKLVDLYTETGRPDEAAIWQQKRDNIRPSTIETEEQN